MAPVIRLFFLRLRSGQRLIFLRLIVKFASFTFIVLWGIDKLNHWGIELLQDVDILNHDLDAFFKKNPVFLLSRVNGR